ncbi:hypothetical protein LCGC14_3067770, partial [marine sediment metagenome]
MGTGGGPGWSKAFYERGQLASDRMPIMQVVNLSREEIRVTVERDRSDEKLPPSFMTDTIPVGGTMMTMMMIVRSSWGPFRSHFSMSLEKRIFQGHRLFL